MGKLYSMTGFAVLTEPYQNGISCEIRSLNSRYLEIGVKLPLAIKDIEDSIKELIQKHVNRGRITCTISFSSSEQPLANLKIDAATVKLYKDLLDQIRDVAGIDQPIRLEHLLAFKDIISFEGTEQVDEALEKNILQLVQRTLDELNEMRNLEGENIEKDVIERLSSIRRNLEKVKALGEQNARVEFDKLHQRLLSLIDETKIDKNRLEMELALISDRVDITEEVTRLQSHIELFEQNLSEGSPIGKKLNFLLQEMHREANTISSKNTMIDISHCAVAIKEDIERIREQVQNIE